MNRIHAHSNSKPLVTVCIATHNRPDSLARTIESVIEQTCDNLEIIIVDDCSQDATPDVVSKFMKSDHRIRSIRHEENKGLAAARNSAIFNATGKYFAFIDDDDLWEVTFVEKFAKLAQDYNCNYVFCCGRREFDGKLMDYIRKGHAPPVASQFYVTDELRRVGGYNEGIKSGVDHDLWLKLAFLGCRIKVLPESLAVINTAQDETRMTMDWERRFNGIMHSLSQWKPDIVGNMGADFYELFQKRYHYSLHKHFFVRSLKLRDFKSALFFFVRCPDKTTLLLEITAACARRMQRRLLLGRILAKNCVL